MKRLVIFDLDGTLVNSSEDICDNINKTLVKFGYPEISLAETVRFVGNGARKLVERALKGEKAENFGEILDFYNNSYNYCGSPKSRAYKGVKELMKRLREEGYLLAVLSNKPQAGTDEVIGKFFPDVYPDCVFGQREGVKTKPDGEGVRLILKELGVKKEEAVFVGDGETDARTYINAGIDGISVLWGFRGRDELINAGATSFAETPEDLYEKIKKF